MTNKIHILNLPITDEFLQQKRIIQDRGELALIEDGEPFMHLSCFSLKKGKGYYRGGHYHKEKTEHLYIVKGVLRVQLVDLDSVEKSEVILNEGQRVTLFPLCAHRFTADQDAQVIEYYNCIYEKDDDIQFQDF